MTMRGLTSIDLTFVVRELKEIKGSRWGKTYQVSEDTFLVKVSGRAGKYHLVITPGRAVYLSNREWLKPIRPSMFAMAMRKYTENAIIKDVEQIDFDRIVLFKLLRAGAIWTVIIELFAPGNILLIDPDGKILLNFRSFQTSSRTIKRGEAYKPPISPPLSPGSSFKEMFESAVAFQGEVWKFLVHKAGIGPPFIDEIVKPLNINPKIEIQQLSHGEVEAIVKSLMELYERVNKTPKPVLYLDRDERIVDYSPFPLKIYSPFQSKYYANMSEMLDDILTNEVKAKALTDKRKERLRKSIEELKTNIERYKNLATEYRKIGDTIYSHYKVVEAIIESLRNDKKVDIAGAKIVEVNKGGRKAKIEVSGITFDIDFSCNVDENAAHYYMLSGKMERKLVSALKALSKLTHEEAEPVEKDKVKIIRPKARWFTRFRWFISSDGCLVVAGKDNKSNKELVNKYLEKDDLFFHIEGAGGSCVIVKLKDELGERTIVEAATYAACNSRAWRERSFVEKVYYVKGEQVKKSAPPGHYIPKGSFYIEGKRNYVSVEVKLAVGFISYNNDVYLVSAPPSALKSSPVHIILRPGDIPKDQAAKIILQCLSDKLSSLSKFPWVKLNNLLSIDELLRILPPGGYEILEVHGDGGGTKSKRCNADGDSFSITKR
ncbi:MAG: hypothetical protein DRN81_01400 [Thermoproteota archaeon]|nr:MAG: hypothetical protein DRN81_01400 [Candidatus Korarchaeota archaeon]